MSLSAQKNSGEDNDRPIGINSRRIILTVLLMMTTFILLILVIRYAFL